MNFRFVVQYEIKAIEHKKAKLQISLSERFL